MLFSGSTFIVALLGLLLVRTNIMRSLAAGAIIVGVVSVAAALTLLPALLGLMGDHVNALRLPFSAGASAAPMPPRPALAGLHRVGPATAGGQPRAGWGA